MKNNHLPNHTLLLLGIFLAVSIASAGEQGAPTPKTIDLPAKIAEVDPKVREGMGYSADWYDMLGKHDQAEKFVQGYKKAYGSAPLFDEATRKAIKEAKDNAVSASGARSFQTVIEPGQAAKPYHSRSRQSSQQPQSSQAEIDAYKRQVAREYGLQLDAQGDFLPSEYVKRNYNPGFHGTVRHIGKTGLK